MLSESQVSVFHMTPAHQGLRRDTITFTLGHAYKHAHNQIFRLFLGPSLPPRSCCTRSGSWLGCSPLQQDFFCHMCTYNHNICTTRCRLIYAKFPVMVFHFLLCWNFLMNKNLCMLTKYPIICIEMPFNPLLPVAWSWHVEPIRRGRRPLCLPPLPGRLAGSGAESKTNQKVQH